MSVAIDPSHEPVGRAMASLGELDAVVDALLDLAPSTIDDDDLAAALTAWPVLESRLDAVQTRLLDMARDRALAQRRGIRKLDHYLQAKTALSGFEARSRVRRSDWLGSFPLFAQAHEAGAMSVEHLERLRKSLDKPRTHGALLRSQQLFVDAASDCSFADFEKVCDYWKIAADPDGDEPADQIAHTSFHARRRSDGMISLTGLLDPLSGQAFLTGWETETQKLALTDHETGEQRSTGSRGAEALLRLVAKGAARADGSHPDPLIHIVMSQNVAEAALRRFAFGADVAVDTDPFDIDKRCELIDGTPIHPRLAIAILGVAALQRVVLDAHSRPVDVSYASRGFPKWLKHILLLRSRGKCETDGCDSPYPWLQVDHQLAHSKGGPTTYANAKIQCRPCNLAKGDR